MLDAVGLNGGLDEHQPALGAGDGAADRDHVQLRIDLHDVQVLDGHLVAAHLAGADLALEDTAGVGGGAHGTGVTVDGAAAVAHGSALSAPALDDALVALTLADAGHVNVIALGEGICLNLGLENLYKAAYKVTEALRQKTDKTTPEMLDELKSSYNSSILAIQQL